MSIRTRLLERASRLKIRGHVLGRWTAVLAAGLLATGCGGDGSNGLPDPSDATTDAAGNPVRLDPAAVDLTVLLEHELPVIVENAESLELALENNDFAKASQSLLLMASMRDDDAATQDAIAEAIRHVYKVAETAAANGDENAQFGMDRLREVFVP